MSLVRVWTDVGIGKNLSLFARIVNTNDSIFTIRFLTKTASGVYQYEDETYEIDDDSITHYLETDEESEIGFKQIGDNEWIRIEDDEDDDKDYEPSSSSGSDEEEEVEEYEDEEDNDYEDDEYD
jgi:hypothetical protein